jgi:hypothetical protein
MSTSSYIQGRFILGRLAWYSEPEPLKAAGSRVLESLLNFMGRLEPRTRPEGLVSTSIFLMEGRALRHLDHIPLCGALLSVETVLQNHMPRRSSPAGSRGP